MNYFLITIILLFFKFSSDEIYFSIFFLNALDKKSFVIIIKDRLRTLLKYFIKVKEMQCFEKENGGVFVDRNDRNRIPLISGKNSRKRLFTLIELFIVIAIIAILVGMLLPALNKARESARGIGCLSKLKHINVTSAFYSSDNKEYELSCATSIDTYAKDCTWKNFISINYMLKNENLLLGNKYFICPSDDAPAKDYYMPSSLGSYGYTTLTGNMREVYIGLRDNDPAKVVSNAPIKLRSIKIPSAVMRLGECKRGGGIFTNGDTNHSVFLRWQIQHYKASQICFFIHNGKANIAYMDGSCRSGKRYELDMKWKSMRNINP